MIACMVITKQVVEKYVFLSVIEIERLSILVFFQYHLIGI
jgi:hypothetical protein